MAFAFNDMSFSALSPPTSPRGQPPPTSPRSRQPHRMMVAPPQDAGGAAAAIGAALSPRHRLPSAAEEVALPAPMMSPSAPMRAPATRRGAQSSSPPVPVRRHGLSLGGAGVATGSPRVASPRLSPRDIRTPSAQPPNGLYGTRHEFRPPVMADVSPPGSPRLSPRSPRGSGEARMLARDPADMMSRAAARLHAMQDSRPGDVSPSRECSFADDGDGGVGPTSLSGGHRRSPGTAGGNYGQSVGSSPGNGFAFGPRGGFAPGGTFRNTFGSGAVATADRGAASGHLSPSSPRGQHASLQHSASWRSTSLGSMGEEAVFAPVPSTDSRRFIEVAYVEGENPMLCFPRLEGGAGTPVIVGMINPTGKAFAAGIRPGMTMATLNGRTEHSRLHGWQVRLILEAPITIGFVPVPSQALQGPSAQYTSVELRLAPSRQALGLPAGKDLWRFASGENWVVAEEIVFKPADDYFAKEDFSQIQCWRPEDSLRPFTDAAAAGLRACSPERATSSSHVPSFPSEPAVVRETSATAKYRNDRSPLRWLAPMINKFVDAVCADGSDDVPDEPHDRGGRAASGERPAYESTMTMGSPRALPHR
eukprot:CAMPEP_0117540530 /NCGR_PEP_ID=MMETSP0784-20121206/43548_1 /TAXON_ID=39447 /ORGANISM="" /LENGTH=590 /DNA_ID=CAMNT_0005337191 /DNA_START=72 /DNA_END=1840 /DNA_ORIENTATION=+